MCLPVCGNRSVQYDRPPAVCIQGAISVQTPGRSRKGRSKLSVLRSEPAAARRSAGSDAANQSKFRSDGLPCKQAMDLLERSLSATNVVITSTLPRGSLQIIQPVRVPESLLKAYTREY